MSTTKIEVVFAGRDVERGLIDARLFAEALLGYHEVFTRANAIANGEDSQATVLVDAKLKAASFHADLTLIQNLVDTAHAITTHAFYDATALAALIGWLKRDKVLASLIDLYKFLKGKKPDKVIQKGDNQTDVMVGNNVKTVNNITNVMYGDSAIRAGLARLTLPMRQADIDRVSITHNGHEQVALDKTEAEYFQGEPFQLETEQSPTEGERTTVLVVSKLSFTEGTTWTFFEQGATVIAKIEDENFWSQVHEHKVTFGEGDRLRVRIAWRIEKTKKGKLVQRNTILKVHEVVGVPVQLLLGAKTKDR